YVSGAGVNRESSGLNDVKDAEEVIEECHCGRSQRDPDAQGIPVMRFHDPMLGCQRKLEEAFTVLRTLRNLRRAGIKDALHQMQHIGDTKAGTLVGIDNFGNKFFENMEEELPLRTRWVDYKQYEWDPYVPLSSPSPQSPFPA
ncbi:hypothetical protein V491_04504, partial [Pseudogymnoascus sp. VKM F-3775]